MTDKIRLTILSIFFACAGLIVAWLWFEAKPVSIAGVNSTQVACLSYAPYRLPGESPFRGDAAVTPERIRTDLTLLRQYTNCVRTYAVTEGLDAVPEIAESLGMTVLMGIWISRNHEENLTKISSALRLANRYPDTVRAVIVGNEVLLRREQTADRIADYLQLAQRGTSVPVTYADVWEFWEVNETLQAHVDFVTVHILPFWEDHPVAVDKSVAHVKAVYRHVLGLFPGKRVVIGETGWPSIGRMRGPARPGRVEQAQFVREFLADAQARGFSDYNLIEAFDQPWKRFLEGAMGGGWGLLSSAGSAKFPMAGPVASRPGAVAFGLLWGGVAALLIALINFVLTRGHNERESRSLVVLLGGATGFTAGALLPAQVAYMVHWSRSPAEWIAAGAIVASGWVLVALLPRLQPGQLMPGVAHLLGHTNRLQTVWAVARLLVLLGAAFMMVTHAFDARYRGYPTLLYLPAVLALVAARFSGAGNSRDAIEERCLAVVIILLVPLMLWPEMPANSQSAWFALTVVALALATLLAPAFRANTSKPSSTPPAPNSAL